MSITGQCLCGSITWEIDGRNVKTRGVDSNQVLAAIKATMRMINMRMQSDQAG